MPAFKNGVAAVQAQAAVWFLLAVTSDAGCLEERLNVFVESDALVGGGGRELGDIDLADVPVIDLFLGQERKGRKSKRKNKCAFHFYLSFGDSILKSFGMQVFQPGSIFTSTCMLRCTEPL